MSKGLRKIVEERRRREREAVREAFPGAWDEPGAADSDLPAGYALSGGGGGYWTLTGPTGVIPGPAGGKWRGRQAAVDAAAGAARSAAEADAGDNALADGVDTAP